MPNTYLKRGQLKELISIVVSTFNGTWNVVINHICTSYKKEILIHGRFVFVMCISKSFVEKTLELRYCRCDKMSLQGSLGASWKDVLLFYLPSIPYHQFEARNISISDSRCGFYFLPSWDLSRCCYCAANCVFESSMDVCSTAPLVASGTNNWYYQT